MIFDVPFNPTYILRRYGIVTLKEHIDSIRERLEQKIFKSETAVRQAIVDPLLRNLGWPTDNTEVVFPEYPVGSGKVDYALCPPASTPRVFIEAKQVGNIEGAEEQLFGYDSRLRVPIAVLTDGQQWHFFHPTGEGTWEERRVHELDLISNDSAESAECLNRYLNYESICSGEAIKAIGEDYKNLVRQRKIEKGLPEAWRALVQGADQSLLKVVAEKTESLCGHLPDDEQVIAFLKNEGLPIDPDPPGKGPEKYRGKDEVLTSLIAEPLIRELFRDKGIIRKKVIVNSVTLTHLERGGLPPATEHVDQLFAHALRSLQENNLAKNVQHGYWEIY